MRIATGRARLARDRLALLRKAIPVGERLGQGLVHGLMAATAAIAAYLPTQVLGLRGGFWGAITALAVVQTEFGAVRTTARDQVLGAAVGGAVGLVILLTLGQGLPAYGLAVVLAMLACWGANVASAARLAGVTATILLLVPHAGSPERMLASRVFEVGWGITVALAVVWAGSRIRDRIERGAATRDADPSAASPDRPASGGTGRSSDPPPPAAAAARARPS